MKLIFDTETTGLAKFNLPLSDASQPRLVQLGCILVDDECNIVSEFGCIVKPEGFVIPKIVSDIHGITHEYAMKVGVYYEFALKTFLHLLNSCNAIIAHNLKFDKHVLDCEFTKVAGRGIREKIEYCTMLNSTPICAIPHKTRAGYKWPKLQEAYKHFYGKEFVGAHSALHDVRATLEVYKALSGVVGPQSSGDITKGLGVTSNHNLTITSTSNSSGAMTTNIQVNRPIHPLSSEYKKLSTDTAIAP